MGFTKLCGLMIHFNIGVITAYIEDYQDPLWEILSTTSIINPLGVSSRDPEIYGGNPVRWDHMQYTMPDHDIWLIPSGKLT